jgi:hypothetical protein
MRLKQLTGCARWTAAEEEFSERRREESERELVQSNNQPGVAREPKKRALVIPFQSTKCRKASARLAHEGKRRGAPGVEFDGSRTWENASRGQVSHVRRASMLAGARRETRESNVSTRRVARVSHELFLSVTSVARVEF